MAEYPKQVGNHVVTSYNPSQYPIGVGDQYLGEVQGFVYDPWNNRYEPNKKQQQDYYVSQGLMEATPEAEKPMGVAEVAGITAGIGLGSEAIKWGADKGIAGLLGPSTSTVATPNIFGVSTLPSTSAGISGGSATGGGAAIGATPGAEAGLLTAAAPVAAALFGAQQIYEQGGKEILAGKAKSKDWVNALSGVAPGLALKALGLPNIGTMLFGPKTKVEDDRQAALYKKVTEAGLDPNTVMSKFEGTQASRDEQLKSSMETTNTNEDFKGWKNGIFINNKWLKSGEAKDLTGLDIQGFAKITEHLLDNGSITAEMSPLDILKAKMDLSDRAIAAGAIRENRGTIDIDNEKLNSFNESHPDFSPSSWDEFKYNTSKQSIQEQGVPWRQELERRKQMEPDWTDWNKIEQELSAAEEAV